MQCSCEPACQSRQPPASPSTTHPVGIVKDLGDLAALGLLREAHHALRADDLDKGEPALNGDRGRQRCGGGQHGGRVRQQQCWLVNCLPRCMPHSSPPARTVSPSIKGCCTGKHGPPEHGRTCLAGAGRPLQQAGDERRVLAVLDLQRPKCRGGLKKGLGVGRGRAEIAGKLP